MKKWIRDRTGTYRKGDRTIAELGWPVGYIRVTDGDRFADIEYEVDMKGLSIWPERLTHWQTTEGRSMAVTEQDRTSIVNDVKEYGEENRMKIDDGVG